VQRIDVARSSQRITVTALVALARDMRAAEAQLDAGMGIPHEAVEVRLKERHLK
jgi:hypothetical protein